MSRINYNNFYDICTHGTIIHALDADRLQKESSKKYTLAQNIKNGVLSGAIFWLREGLLFAATTKVINTVLNRPPIKFNLGTNFSDKVIFILANTCIEEILFRLFLQNGIHFLQNRTSSFVPLSLQKNRVFKWLCTPTARILMVNAIFAGLHLNNLKIDIPFAIAQTAFIVMSPMESVIYETSGNIITPLICHAVVNYSSLLLMELQNS